MAEVTGLRNNATPYPVYGAPWGIVFPMLDADGDLVTGATTPDAEVSKNGDTFADCTNESTEIATTSGMYYLLLTATEMTADVVAVIAKSATAGMKTTPIVLYPAKLVTLRSGTVGANAADGTTLQLDSGAVAVDDYYNGCLLVGTLDAVVEARIISDYVGSTKVCTVSPAFVTTPDNTDTFVVYQPLGRQSNSTLPAVVAGAAGGLFIAGTNAPVVITGSGPALSLTSTGASGAGLSIQGNAGGNGILTIGGSTAGSAGISSQGGSGGGPGIVALGTTNDDGLQCFGNGTGAGIYCEAGATGTGIAALGGATSGDGIRAVATTGDGIEAIGAGGGFDINADIQGSVSGSIGSLGTTAKSDVNAEVVDAINVDTYAEPGQGLPAATASLVAKVNYLYKSWRNRKTQTSTTLSLFADDATTVDHKATVSDNGTTYDHGEIASGP